VVVKLLRPRIARHNARIANPPQKKADPFYLSPEWRRLVVRLIAERGRRCQDCGKTGGWIEADHVHEIKDGGAKLDPANVRLLCRSCHATKTHAAKRVREDVSGGNVL
jgi:5-methylcytosine-specific restriction protein A